MLNVCCHIGWGFLFFVFCFLEDESGTLIGQTEEFYLSG